MTIRLSPRWRTGNTEIDARLLPLLRMVGREGSLNRAVAELQLSYRHAWGVLGKIERALGRRLVLMERGRGARLSPFAEKLIAADAAAAELLDRELAGALRALNEAPTAARGVPPEPPLVVHASHDLALAALRDSLLHSEGVAPDLHFRGSLDCLASLARRECDMAGFHVPVASAAAAAFAPYRPWLKDRTLRLVRFVDRRQGLMVARGNPKRLLGLEDLAEKGARFVNRQPESGTRLAFDRLLAEAGLGHARINGYPNEEFTHAAVAATVASGMADAGFGIEAAARQHGLDFISLANERYFLAARAGTLARPAAQAMLAGMQAAAFLESLQILPGYEADGIGEIITAREMLRPS